MPGTRRGFLIGALLGFSSALPAAWIRHLPHHETWPWLRRLVPRLELAAEIGRRYLRGRASEASSSWLAERLVGGDLPDSLDLGELATLRRRLNELRSADFRAGDLVFIDGWALTRTEVRLLALVAVCAAR